MEKILKKGAFKTLETLGVPVRTKPGRRPLGLGPGEEIWLVGDGAVEPNQVLAAPFDGVRVDGVRTVAAENRTCDLARMWVAEYIGARTAERLVQMGDAFVDVAGNAHLKLPGLVVHVYGKRARPTKPTPIEARPERRAWRRAALRVLFQLLCNPRLVDRAIQDIADAGDVAVGTVKLLLRDLERTGNLVRLGGHKRRFVPDQRLIETWIDEYTHKLRHTLFEGRFRAPTPDWWRDFQVNKHHAVWGGEMAAMLLGANLRPGVRTLYTDKPLNNLLKAARLVPDDQGTVEVRRAFWTKVPDQPRDDVTPLLLTIADLEATRDGRCTEAAQYLRETYSDGLLRQD